MAKRGGSDVGFFLVGGYDIMGDTVRVTVDGEANLEESHGLGDSWVEQSYTGLRKFTIQQDGFFDDAANAMNAALVTLAGAARVICLGLSGNTVNATFMGAVSTVQSRYSRLSSRGQLHKATSIHIGSGELKDGIVIQPWSTKSGADWDTNIDGTGNADSGASSGSGGTGLLQVSAYTAGTATGCIVKIRSSADDSTYADECTFTTVTSAPQAQSANINGTINRYLLVTGDFTGTPNGSSSITAMVGLIRN